MIIKNIERNWKTIGWEKSNASPGFSAMGYGANWNTQRDFGFLYFWEEEIKSSHFTLTLKAKTTKQQNMKTNVYGDLLQDSKILLYMKGEPVRRLWKNKRNLFKP